MNNFEKFYELTGKMIDLLKEPLIKHNDNYEYEKKKILKKIEKFSAEDKLCHFFSWQLLIDIAFLGLNREKIENSVDINWDNYVPQGLIGEVMLEDKRPSKVPYFKEWIKVKDCKSKYLSEGAHFWILRLRNSFMHGNYEFDYNHIERQRIKIYEGSPASADIDMDVMYVGLDEFIQDNFHNIEHDEFGVSSDHVDLFAINYENITNKEQLIKFLKYNVFIGERKKKEGYYYNGSDIVSSATGKVVDRAREKQKMTVVDKKLMLETQEYVDPEIDLAVLTEKDIETLVWVLENKYHIYNAPKQQRKIFQAIRRYVFPMYGINQLLHEFGIYAGAIDLDKSEYKSTGIDIKKTFAVFNEEEPNIENAITILKLYRFLYRIQNKNFEAIDYSSFDCDCVFLSDGGADFQKRVDKNKLAMSEQEAKNKAYIDTMRNALAHGNVKIKYMVQDEKLYPVFVLKDEWTNQKTGDTTCTKIVSPTCVLENFLDWFDVKKVSADEILNSFNCPFKNAGQDDDEIEME